MKLKNIRKYQKQTGKKIKKTIKNFFRFYKKKLFWNLFLSFVLLFCLILASSWLEDKKNGQGTGEKKPIPVMTFQIGSVPRVQVQGQVEKNRIVKVFAQAGGIVNRLYVKEGSQVKANQGALAYLASNYQGGNAGSIQRQLALKQYQFIKDTYSDQKELISKQKQIASETESNFIKLREISENSLEETRSLINLNQEILDYYRQNLDAYEATDSADSNRDLIAQTKQLKISFQAAVNQLRSVLKSLEYQTDTEAPPSDLARIQKELIFKQLELQEKSLDLNREVASLQYQLAQIQESLSYPVSPVNGIVQEVHVRENDLISPGRLLFTISAEGESASQVKVMAAAKIALNLSLVEKARIHLKEEVLEIAPSFISAEPTNNSLHLVLFDLPPEAISSVAHLSYLTVDLPLGFSQSGQTIPLIPIDAVYQTSRTSFVYVIEDGRVLAKEVALGEVYGQYVTILGGLEGNWQLITDRNVIEGDLVELSDG
ncbi:MAG: hypothetical protein JW991_00395 [Candidatus Pacebacteria bacterium]|nr:hypothetical protein [Candidatus Paceibacterota bacterium]